MERRKTVTKVTSNNPSQTVVCKKGLILKLLIVNVPLTPGCELIGHWRLDFKSLFYCFCFFYCISKNHLYYLFILFKTVMIPSGLFL